MALVLLLTLAAALFLVFIAMAKPWLAPYLALALALRVGVALMHTYVYDLPQGGADAQVFVTVARGWAEDGCLGAFQHFDPRESYVYSAVLGVLFACAGSSVVGAQLLNVLLGTLAVGLLASAARYIWSHQAARGVALVVAVFPALLIYSAVTLREAFILAFFSLAVYAVARHHDGRERGGWLLVAVASLAAASLFHGGMVMGIVGIAIAKVSKFLQKGRGDRAASQRVLLLGASAICLVAVLATFFDQIFVPKIGNLASLDTELVSETVASRARGDAAYLTGLTISSPLDVLWQAPIRVAYLLFAPFPWNISSASHVLGLVDGAIYLLLTVLFLKNRREILSNPGARTVLFVCVVLAFVFAFGTSNFGTGMRHRAKFYVAMFVVVAPFLRLGARSSVTPLHHDGGGTWRK